MIVLSKRLKCIYDMVPNTVVADIGADHGKLIILLADNKRIIKGYAVENKKGPYNRLLKAVINSGLEDEVIPLLSDGLADLPPTVKTIILAGLGGHTIIDILKKDIEKLHHIDTIIIDAHTANKAVREFVCQNGYVIAEEKMVKEDNIFYEIIKFIRAGRAIYSDEDFEFGPILSEEKSALFREKCQERIKEIDSILEKNNLPQQRIQQLLSEKQRIRNKLS